MTLFDLYCGAINFEAIPDYLLKTAGIHGQKFWFEAKNGAPLNLRVSNSD